MNDAEADAVAFGAGGRVSVRVVGDGVIVVSASGTADEKMADWLCRRLDEIRGPQRAPLCVFNDYEGLDRYLPAAREAVVAWSCRNPDVQNHALVRSRLVAMAAAVARLTHGVDVRSYSSRTTWAEALRRATQVAQATPSPA